jgi:hypothetical protein
MVETKLVESKIEDAETLLRELDQQKFPVEAMFWINRAEANWRLIIGSTFVTEEGTRAAYHRLGEIYDKLDLLGLALEDNFAPRSERKTIFFHFDPSRAIRAELWPRNTGFNTTKRSFIAGATPSPTQTSLATSPWMI